MVSARWGSLAIVTICAACLHSPERMSIQGPKPDRGFLLDKYEVSVRDYRACVRRGICTRPFPARGQELLKACTYYKRRPRMDDYPVDCVSAEQAQAYCEWHGGRLPTLEEWRWEATGHSHEWMYPWGSTPEPDCERAAAQARDGRICAETGVVPVYGMPMGRSISGVYNLFGNVSEWVTTGDARRISIVGVAYYNSEPLDAWHFSSAERGTLPLKNGDWGEITIGFRCAYDAHSVVVGPPSAAGNGVE
jgi:formylglycine-generating enzyme required for sulfatase activity